MANSTIANDIFESCSTIINTAIANISYDSSKLCTIIDPDLGLKNSYLVTDGSVKFHATSTGEVYYKNDQVFVLIPQGDWSQEKIILGKKDSTKLKPKSTLNTYLKKTSLIKYPEKKMLFFSLQDKKISEKLAEGTFKDFEKFHPILNLIGLEAEFQADFTNLSEKNKNFIINGYYSIDCILNCFTNNYERVTIEKSISSSDICGNPFALKGFFKARNLYSLSEIVDEINKLTISKIKNLKDLKKIDYEIYLNLNPKDFQLMDDSDEQNLKLKLSVKNIELSVGCSIEKLEKKSYLFLYCDKDSYKENKNFFDSYKSVFDPYTFYFLYINYSEENGFSFFSFDNDYTLSFQKLNESSEWEEVLSLSDQEKNEERFFMYSLDGSLPENQYRLVLQFKEEALETSNVVILYKLDQELFTSGEELKNDLNLLKANIQIEKDDIEFSIFGYKSFTYRDLYEFLKEQIKELEEVEDDFMTYEKFKELMKDWIEEQKNNEKVSSQSQEARKWAEAIKIVGETSGKKSYQSFTTQEQVVMMLYQLYKELNK